MARARARVAPRIACATRRSQNAALCTRVGAASLHTRVCTRACVRAYVHTRARTPATHRVYARARKRAKDGAFKYVHIARVHKARLIYNICMCVRVRTRARSSADKRNQAKQEEESAASFKCPHEVKRERGRKGGGGNRENGLLNTMRGTRIA